VVCGSEIVVVVVAVEEWVELEFELAVVVVVVETEGGVLGGALLLVAVAGIACWVVVLAPQF
jgi:hypothetical protein